MASALVAAFLVPGGALPAAAPADFEQTLRQGLLALNAGDLEAARSQLEQASRIDPADSRVWLALAQTYARAGEAERSGQAAETASRGADANPAVLHGLAIFFSQSGQWVKAADAELEYARKVSSDPDAFPRAAAFYLEADKPRQAITAAHEGLSAKDSAALYNVLGKAHETAREPEDAVEALRKAVELSPYDESYRYDLSLVLLRHQNFDRALLALDEARKVFDKSPRIEVLRGVAYYGQRKFEDAVDAFLRGASLAPGFEQPNAFLGRTLTHAGDRIDEAIERFRAFSKARPDHYLGPYLEGKALLAQMGPERDPELAGRAAALLAVSVERNNDYWESHFELGAALETLRRFEEAMTHFRRSAELNPTASKPRYRLARVYQRLGMREEAKAEHDLHQQLTEEERKRVTSSISGLGPASSIVE